MQQLHGIHAQHIKNEWQCQQHLGENGHPGACYITLSGVHVGLNIRQLASWAAAIVYHSALDMLLILIEYLLHRLWAKLPNTNLLISLSLMVSMMLNQLFQDYEGVLDPLHKPLLGHPHLPQSKL